MIPGRLFTSRRHEVGGESEDPGAAGAGRTAPLVPRTPVLSGAAARRIEEYAAPPEDRRLDMVGRADCALHVAAQVPTAPNLTK